MDKPLRIVGVLDTHYEKLDEKEYSGLFNNRVDLSGNHYYNYFSEESFRYLNQNFPSKERKLHRVRPWHERGFCKRRRASKQSQGHIHQFRKPPRGHAAYSRKIRWSLGPGFNDSFLFLTY